MNDHERRLLKDRRDVSDAEFATLSGLIDLIYQGATEPSLWPKILTSIAEWLQAPKALLFTPMHPPEAGGFYFSHGIDEMIAESWRANYRDSGVWRKTAIKKKLFAEGNIYFGTELIPHDELIASAWYKNFLGRFDIVRMMTCVVFGIESTSMMPTTCGFYRGINDPEFSAREKKHLALLLPHLSRALGVKRLLRDADLKLAAGKAALDRLSGAILLMDDAGEVVFMNAMAHQLVSDEDGLMLHAAKSPNSQLGMLASADARVNEELSAMVKTTLDHRIVKTQHFSQVLKIPRPSGRPSYLFKVSRLAAKNEFCNEHSSAALIAFIIDSASDLQMNTALLCDAYGFTPAEARVAVANFTAGSIDDIADSLGISRNTVKAHLKKIYSKAGVDNQSKLIKLLLSFATVHS